MFRPTAVLGMLDAFSMNNVSAATAFFPACAEKMGNVSLGITTETTADSLKVRVDWYLCAQKTNDKPERQQLNILLALKH